MTVKNSKYTDHTLCPTTKGKKLIEQSIQAKDLEAALTMTGSLLAGELAENSRYDISGMQQQQSVCGLPYIPA